MFSLAYSPQRLATLLAHRAPLPKHGSARESGPLGARRIVAPIYMHKKVPVGGVPMH